MTLRTWIVLASALTACHPKDDLPKETYVISYDDLSLAILDADCDSYFFGAAATGADNGWFGEDCANGMSSYNYCHPSTADGVTLRTVTDPELVVEGDTTLFSYDDEGTLTFYVENTCDKVCYAFGDAPDYYKDCVGLNNH